MGKNKKGPKANVFKVAGAKSLKKTKAKAVNLGLKNIKQKVSEIDKEFLQVNKDQKSNVSKNLPTQKSEPQQPKKQRAPVSKEEVEKAVEDIVKMDL